MPVDGKNGGAKRRLYAVVRGRVQGVGFRWFVISTVRNRLPNVNGWVKNLPDGTVEVVAEGQEQDLETLVNHLKRGPSGAHVKSVDPQWAEPRGGLLGFDVSY